MRAGQLRQRVLLQRKSYEQDQKSGAMVETWQDVANVWASVEPLSVREFIASQAMQAGITARAVIRYRADMEATMRLIHRGKIYNIIGILADKNSGLEYQTLTLSEGVNDG